MDWIKERLQEPSTLLFFAFVIYAYGQVTGTDTGTIVDWIKSAVSDISLLAATLLGAVAAARRG